MRSRRRVALRFRLLPRWAWQRTPADARSSRRRRHDRRRVRRRVVLGLLGGVLLVVLFLAFELVTALLALGSARHQAATLQAELTAGQTSAAERTLSDLQASTHRAHARTEGPLWSLAGHLPLLGGDLGAVSTVSAVLDDVAQTSLPTALSTAEAVVTGRFRPVDGRFDLGALRAAAPGVRRAAATLDAGDARLGRIDARHLSWPLSGVLGQLQDRVHGARAAADATSLVMSQGPRLLGADGPRRYLLMVQNDAEVRATGGLPGSFAILDARGGRVTMGWQGSSADVGLAPRPPVPLTAGERSVYGDALGTDIRDVNVSPDFPRAARMAAALLARNQRTHIDGVVSVDPVALAYVLQGTGDLKLPDGRALGVGNVVELLLHQVYQSVPDPSAQDHFYASVARTVFAGVTAGRGKQIAVVHGLTQGASEHRVLLWVRDPGVERALAGTAVAGDLVDPATPDVPRVGAYLDDASGGKMEWFLRAGTSVTGTSCTSAGAQTLATRTVLHSLAPPGGRGLSRSVTGYGTAVPPGQMLLNLRLLAPVGGTIRSISVDGHGVPVTLAQQSGRPVDTVVVRLRPGQRVTVRSVMVSGTGQRAGAVVSTTPGVTAQPNGVGIPSACG